MFGFAIDIMSPRINERLALQGDIFYLSSKYTSFSTVSGNYSTIRNDVLIDLKQLKIPLGLKYIFPERRITPFISAGLSSTIQLTSKFEWVQEIEASKVVQTYEKEPINIKNNQLGYWGGLGVYRTFLDKYQAHLELRYEWTNGIINSEFNPYTFSTLSSNISNFQLIIGLSL